MILLNFPTLFAFVVSRIELNLLVFAILCFKVSISSIQRDSGKHVRVLLIYAIE